jgi:serpin B
MAQTPSAPTPDQAAVAQGNNLFAVDLYGQLRRQDGNLFFSPESISTAFAMAYAGARGATATEMAAALHFTLPPDKLHPAMGALLNNLNAAHPGYQLHVADALWAEKDYTFLDDFLKLTSADYGAGFNRVDFKGAPDATRSMINQWVEQKTEDKIKDLLPPGSVKSDTRLVLANAIYFKGDWATQFSKAATQDEDFHVSASQTIKAPLMHLRAKLGYFNGETFQAVAIPYKSGELSMIVLLPNDVGGLPALEQAFTGASVVDQRLAR